MIQTTLHIEQLLLFHDCVIVPGLGGFVTHDCSASYIEEEGLFLPPYRSVTFNPRLTMNDGLLANAIANQQSISYEEALSVIKNDVTSIRTIIQTQGSFFMQGVGRLHATAGNSYDFEPIECGIASPSHFGLDCIETSTLQATEKKSKPLHIKRKDKDNFTFNISASALHYAAVAAVAAVFYFICIAPLNVAIQKSQSKAYMFRQLWSLIMPERAIQDAVTDAQTAPAKESSSMSSAVVLNTTMPSLTGKKDITEESTITVDKEENSSEKNAISAEIKSTDSQSNTSSTKKKTPTTLSKGYTIVVASAVTLTNANDMIERWNAQGINGAEIFTRGKMNRVIYGRYSTEEEAHKALNANRATHNSEFAEAWVYEIPKQ